MGTKKGLQASNVMRLLIVLLIVLAAILALGSIYGMHILSQSAKKATDNQIDADNSQNDGARLQQLSGYLKQNAATVDQTTQVAATLHSFTQQDKLIAALNDDAQKAHVKITGLTFGSANAVGSPAAGASGDSNQINLTIDSPVAYTNFLQFMRLIENGIAPLQIKTLSLDVDANNSANVSVTNLVLQMEAL